MSAGERSWASYDDNLLVDIGQRLPDLTGEVTKNALTDRFDITQPLAQVFILNIAENIFKLVDSSMQGRFGVNPLFFDNLDGIAYQHFILENHQVSIDNVQMVDHALVGNATLDLAQLFLRLYKSALEGFHLLGHLLGIDSTLHHGRPVTMQ